MSANGSSQVLENLWNFNPFPRNLSKSSSVDWSRTEEQLSVFNTQSKREVGRSKSVPVVEDRLSARITIKFNQCNYFIKIYAGYPSLSIRGVHPQDYKFEDCHKVNHMQHLAIQELATGSFRSHRNSFPVSKIFYRSTILELNLISVSIILDTLDDGCKCSEVVPNCLHIGLNYHGVERF
nr:hypothetical protein CFP56_59158 [Quercus suber]